MEMKDKYTAALEALCRTIECTGGILERSDGFMAPACDPEWIDLAEAYLLACEALGVEARTKE